MTIDIITALDQAFFQAETAQNDQVRTQAIQHFINVASIVEQQLQVAGIKEVRIGGKALAVVPTEEWARQFANAFDSAKQEPLTGAVHPNYYISQRDELLDVLNQVRAYFEGGEVRHGLDVRQVVNCALEHFRRDGVSPKNTMLTTRHFVEHATKLHAKPLPAETEAQLPPKPVRTYQTGVRGLGDPGLQWTPVAASEQPVPPAPDVINMANPANWLPGDKLLRKYVHGNFPHFTSGREYTVTSNGPDVLTIMGNDGVEVTYPHKPFCEPASNFFTWLRHGDAPTTQA